MVGLLLMAQLLVLTLKPGGLEGIRAFDNVAMLLASGAAAAACIVPYRRATGRLRWAWGFLGLSCLSWAAGQAIWAYYEHVLRQPAPYPSWADAGYFGMIPLGALALPAFFSPLESARVRTLAFLDGLIVGVSLLMLEWSLLLRDIYQATAPASMEQWLGLAYPIGDLVLLVLVLHLVIRTPVGSRLPVAAIAVGLVGLSLAHLAYAALILEGAYYTGHLIDVGWTGGFLLIAYAALVHDTQVQPVVPRIVASRVRNALLPYAPLVLVAFVLLLPLLGGRGVDAFLYASGVALGALVFFRQALVIRENLHLRRELEDARGRLEAHLHERAQLMGNVAHDLSGPLTPIRIHLHLLRESLPPSERGSIEVLERSVAHLQHLIGDLADLSRIEAGKLRMHPAPTDLAVLARETVTSLASTAADKALHWEVDAPDTLPVTADANRVNQVLYNLVRNAIKFTPAGGRIRLRVESRTQAVRVLVEDTGPGLAPQQIQRLFQPFSQVHDGATTTEPGTGLGLYISRGIIEAHGGRIWCQSEGPGKGSTFGFELPASVPQPPAAA